VKQKMGDFRGVSLQASLVKEIETTIKRVPYYRSVAEFVSEAVRLRLEELRNPKEANHSG
jgi:Arc/MetJ-type ribon-helix-helix transcriptional regulator